MGGGGLRQWETTVIMRTMPNMALVCGVAEARLSQAEWAAVEEGGVKVARRRVRPEGEGEEPQLLLLLGESPGGEDVAGAGSLWRGGAGVAMRVSELGRPPPSRNGPLVTKRTRRSCMWCQCRLLPSRSSSRRAPEGLQGLRLWAEGGNGLRLLRRCPGRCGRRSLGVYPRLLPGALGVDGEVGCRGGSGSHPGRLCHHVITQER